MGELKAIIQEWVQAFLLVQEQEVNNIRNRDLTLDQGKFIHKLLQPQLVIQILVRLIKL